MGRIDSTHWGASTQLGARRHWGATTLGRIDRIPVILFDTGADRTYVTEHLVNWIGPGWVGTRIVSCAAFGEDSPGAAALRNIYDISLTKLSTFKLPRCLTFVPPCSACLCPKVS